MVSASAGGAWGYITDTPGSGLLQLGARFYWPEVARFIQQDPIGDGDNWYAYAGNNPVTGIDPEGLDYGDLSLTFPVGIVGIQLGPDPCANAKPWRWWAASTWRSVHPYVGPGIGFPGLSAMLAPDWPGGKKQIPVPGWHGAVSGGCIVGGSIGGPLSGPPDYFWEVGGTSPGAWAGAYYLW